MRKILAPLTVALLVTALSINPASAHTTLVYMTPAEDSVVSTAPTKVVLTFDEKISPDGNGLTVTAPDGVRVDVGTPKAVDNELSVDLGPITLNGHYLVNYRVVSSDGHPVESSEGFDVLIASLTATAKAKIDVSAEGETGIEKGEGRSGSENDFLTIGYYVLFAAVLGGLYIYWRRRRSRIGKTSS